MRLPAGVRTDVIAFLEACGLRINNDTSRLSGYNRSDRHRVSVGFCGTHAAPHVGVQRQVKCFYQHLSVIEWGQLLFLDLKIAFGGLAHWPGGQDNTQVFHLGHEFFRFYL